MSDSGKEESGVKPFAQQPSFDISGVPIKKRRLFRLSSPPPDGQPSQVSLKNDSLQNEHVTSAPSNPNLEGSLSGLSDARRRLHVKVIPTSVINHSLVKRVKSETSSGNNEVPSESLAHLASEKKPLASETRAEDSKDPANSEVAPECSDLKGPANSEVPPESSNCLGSKRKPLESRGEDSINPANSEVVPESLVGLGSENPLASATHGKDSICPAYSEVPSESLVRLGSENPLVSETAGKYSINPADDELKSALADCKPADNILSKSIAAGKPKSGLSAVAGNLELSLGLKEHLVDAEECGSVGKCHNQENVVPFSRNASLSMAGTSYKCKAHNVNTTSDSSSRCSGRLNWDLNTTMDAWDDSSDDKATGRVTDNSLHMHLSPSFLSFNLGQVPSSSGSNKDPSKVVPNTILPKVPLVSIGSKLSNSKSVKQEPLDERNPPILNIPSAVGETPVSRELMEKFAKEVLKFGNFSYLKSIAPRSIKSEPSQDSSREMLKFVDGISQQSGIGKALRTEENISQQLGKGQRAEKTIEWQSKKSGSPEVMKAGVKLSHEPGNIEALYKLEGASQQLSTTDEVEPNTITTQQFSEVHLKPQQPEELNEAVEQFNKLGVALECPGKLDNVSYLSEKQEQIVQPDKLEGLADHSKNQEPPHLEVKDQGACPINNQLSDNQDTGLVKQMLNASYHLEQVKSVDKIYLNKDVVLEASVTSRATLRHETSEPPSHGEWDVNGTTNAPFSSYQNDDIPKGCEVRCRDDSTQSLPGNADRCVSEEDKINLSGDVLEDDSYGSEFESDGNSVPMDIEEDGVSRNNCEDGEVQDRQLQCAPEGATVNEAENLRSAYSDANHPRNPRDIYLSSSPLKEKGRQMEGSVERKDIIAESLSVITQVSDESTKMDGLDKSDPALLNEEVLLTGDDVGKDPNECNNRSRIIDLPKASNMTSPDRTRFTSNSSFQSHPGRERLPDMYFDGDKFHPRGRDEAYNDDGYQNFSRERHQGHYYRNNRLNFNRGRGRFPSRSGDRNPERDFPSNFYNEHPDFVRQKGDAEFMKNIGPDGNFINNGRGGRSITDSEFRHLPLRRHSPEGRDRAVGRGLRMVHRVPRNIGEDGSEVLGPRHPDKIVRGYPEDVSEHTFVRPQPPYEGLNGHFGQGPRNFPSMQRRASQIHSKSPLRSRSPGQWSSSRRRSPSGFGASSDLTGRMSPPNFRMDRMRSPGHPGFIADMGIRRHGSPPYLPRPNDMREMDPDKNHFHPRSINPNRNPNGRPLLRNNRRFVNHDPHERKDGDEFFVGPMQSDRFHDLGADGDGDDRRRFSERCGPVRPFRPSFNGVKGENFHPHPEDGPRPFRIFSEDQAMQERGNQRDREFDRRMKNRLGNVNRRVRDMEEQEGNYRHGGQVLYDNDFDDISRGKRKRFD
ncbi:hypothetical protein LINPERPRIM_LOCUS38159 [Linum perenne]